MNNEGWNVIKARKPNQTKPNQNLNYMFLFCDISYQAFMKK